ncbi:Transport protein [Segniliparus rotundus DSM 44985]|uniref:Transport protein n=1 Tax=Segniliparus rotundus (strain ATCC BAA-972 / CDC 1076 / CIP 108378 / DSM 44985 / JCM 13578) TaxID=640132 RepID=D6ZFS4_SEGRD|nr:RND family transporter [Segniliparus rotundus]ADG97798.1 Transport protein [Segniliparus rotundus DSM 44985]
MSNTSSEKTFFARAIRVFALPIIIGWIAVAVIFNLAAPQLEAVGKEHSVSLAPSDAPALVAMKEMGKVFRESDSDSAAMVVIEQTDKDPKKTLGKDAHAFYDELVRKFRADTKHVQHVQDFWGDRVTEEGAESTDHKAAYVQLNLAGNMGETLANESVESVRKIVEDSLHDKKHPAPPGVTAYVTGQAALMSDQNEAGNASMELITLVTFAVIITMLLFIYRSIVTVLIMLLMVGVQLGASRGLIAFLGHNGILGLSTFATNMLTSLAIAAATDYVIFWMGRYQEARGAGEDKETAYYTTFHGTAHVVLGSGLTIAGAIFCLSFTRLPYFQTMGVPCSIGLLVTVLAAVTLGPAVITAGSAIGLFEPKRKMKVRTWRKVGTAIVRWPAPILAVTVAVALIGLAALPGFQPNYNDRDYMPKTIPANIGFQAADRHFSQARMNPEMLFIETDHDLRNPADMIVIDRIAKAVFRVPGIARVQAITRPQGTPLEHTSIPFQLSMQSAGQVQQLGFMRDMMGKMKVQSDQMTVMIGITTRMIASMEKLTNIMHGMVGQMDEMYSTIKQLRDDMGYFDDYMRPLRNYFYWETNCWELPWCWAFRSVFDALDGIDKMTEQFGPIITNMHDMDKLMPPMVADMKSMLPIMTSMRDMMLEMYDTQTGIMDHQEEGTKNATAMGKAFDASKNDDSFYLPPEIFENADFKRAMKNFISPDGHAVRFIISHKGIPASAEGISHIAKIRQAAQEAVKGTPLEDGKIYLGGTAATYADMSEGANFDLLIAGVSAICLIFIVMLILTRSLVAALVIVGTVVLSLGASFGLSVLIWQDILGIPLHWMVLAMTVIILLAVGSDYNLLLVSRMKEELPAGIKTGMIRSIGGTGTVVTNAGLVFAFTMGAMVVSDLRIIGQVGTAICLGLLFDTLIVRAFMTPSIAALLGRWFWWPVQVRARPARAATQSS